MSTEDKKKLAGAIITIVSVLVGCFFGLTSCNVTRNVTTSSSFVQHGDTTTTIVTKTIESYDARKH